MALPSLIPSLAQFPQLLAGGSLAFEPVEAANRGVECVLAPGELVGGLPHSALDRAASPDTGEQFLDSFDDGAFSDLRADCDPAGAISDRRAAIERELPLAHANDHAGAAGTAAENPEASEQAFRLRPGTTRYGHALQALPGLGVDNRRESCLVQHRAEAKFT